MEEEFDTNVVGMAHPREAVAGQHPEAWRFILLTNWMGTTIPVEIYTQIRRFVMLGDTTWVKGKVIKNIAITAILCRYRRAKRAANR